MKAALNAEMIAQINSKSYKLHIKNLFHKLTGGTRYNHLTCYMVEDKLQMHIDNGHNKEGMGIKGSIRLTQSEMKQLIEFMQRNLK